MISNKAIYEMVSRIPAGQVATYGQIAKLLGYPNHARQVGRALSQLNNNSSIPWHRVINAKGKISPRGMNGCDDYQRILLEEEGILFNRDVSITLENFQWNAVN